jgi:hypothetical protein
LLRSERTDNVFWTSINNQENERECALAGILDNPLQLLDEDSRQPAILIARLEAMEWTKPKSVFTDVVQDAAEGLMLRGQADYLEQVIVMFGNYLEWPDDMLLDAQQRSARMHLAEALVHLDALGFGYPSGHNGVIRGAYLEISRALTDVSKLTKSLPWTEELYRRIAKAGITSQAKPRKLRKRIRQACQVHERLFAHWTPTFDHGSMR